GSARAFDRRRRRLVGACGWLPRRTRAQPVAEAVRGTLSLVLPRRRRSRLRHARTPLTARPQRRHLPMSIGDIFWLFFMFTALQLARAIRGHKVKVTVFVPHYAMSGGTLIALSADEIVMSKHAVLGPIDPQLGQFPAASLVKVVEQKPIAEIDDETLIKAD